MDKKLFGIIVFFLFLFSTPVSAGENDLLKLLKVLNDNGTITAAQYEALKNGIESNQAVHGEEKIEDPIQVSTRGGLEIATYDGQYAFELGGQLMLDGAAYHEDGSDLGDGTELRRARVSLEGTLAGEWGYEFAVDFADGEVDVKDAHLSYEAFWPSKILVGQFKEPFSLEEMTSAKRIPFMERALPNEFAPGRSLGIGAKTYGDMWTAALGIFGEGYDDDAGDEGDEGWALTGRGTFSPVHSDTRVIHLGAAGSFRKTDDEGEVRFKVRPESHITDVRYADTGKIEDVDAVGRYGLEAAGVMGPFSLQGEYIYADLSRDSGADDLSFDGWYVWGSWFVTGESRSYKKKKGRFGRIKPKGEYGALELVARYSVIDLNDGPVTGGREENFTLGLNWYLNRYMRIMANYIWVDNDENADADGDLSGDNDPRIFQTRVQMDF